MLLPNACLLEENGRTRGKIALRQVPALHGPKIDPIGLSRIGPWWKGLRLLAREYLVHQVRGGDADGLEGFDETAHGAFAQIGIVGRINRGGRNGGKGACDFRRNKGLAFAVGENRQQNYNGVRGYPRQFRNELLVGEPIEVDRFEFPLAVFNRAPSNLLPRTIGRTGSGNDKEAARVGLQPFRQPKCLVEIELGNDPCDVWRRSLGCIAMGRNRREYDRNLGRNGVAILEEERQGRATQSQHQVRW